MSPEEAFPLTWPIGWPRTPYPVRSRYGNHTVSECIRGINKEVRLLGGTDMIISSNLKLRNDKMPKSGQVQPSDRGVAVYFTFKKKPICIACDKWKFVEDNMWAIFLTISSLRQIDRSGSSELLERAFTGFMSLPAANQTSSPDAWGMLGLGRNATRDEISAAYRSLSKTYHPDMPGGNAEMFVQLTKAKDYALSLASK